MFLKCLLNLKTSVDNNNPNCDERKRILRFYEACNGCSFHLRASLIKNLLGKIVFAKYFS